MLGDWNTWLSSHETLAISVFVPVVTLAIGLLTTWITIRSQNRGAQLQRQLKVSEFRQKWINDLRDDMAIFFGATMEGARSGSEAVDHREMIATAARIMLRMNPNDQDYEALTNALRGQMDYAFDPNERAMNLPNENDRFLAVSQRILKREWERLKDDVEIQKAAGK